MEKKAGLAEPPDAKAGVAAVGFDIGEEGVICEESGFHNSRRTA
jgi:hypothetical protein